jgi:hypothetical protein
MQPMAAERWAKEKGVGPKPSGRRFGVPKILLNPDDLAVEADP